MSSSPLVEVVFEIRFKPQSNFATDLLIAVNQFFTNHLNIVQADGLQFPVDLKSQQPDLYYVPSYKVNFPDFSLLISDGSFVVLKHTIDVPYDGWINFRNIPNRILQILKSKNKIGDIQRYSIKYTNLIQNPESFNNLNLSISVGSVKLEKSKKFSLRTEENQGDFVILNDVSSHVDMEVTNDMHNVKRTYSGILLVIDVINTKGIKNINEVDKEFTETLEQLHEIALQKYSNIFNEG